LEDAVREFRGCDDRLSEDMHQSEILEIADEFAACFGER
jgi:hypothetical protein